MSTASEYTDRLYSAVTFNLGNLISPGCIHHGRKGALRLARGYGYGLADFAPEEAQRELITSYSKLCVRAYQLKPPIDAKEWINEASKSMGKALRRRNGHENHRREASN
jgi:hypothetical protein